MSEDETRIENIDPFDEEPERWTTSDTFGAVILVALFLLSLALPILLSVF